MMIFDFNCCALFLKAVKESHTCVFKQFDDQFKLFVAPVVWVGNIAMHGMVSQVLSHEPYLAEIVRRPCHRLDVAGILLVHGDNDVVVVEILRRKLARPAVEIISMTFSMGPHPAVRQLPHMPMAYTGRLCMVQVFFLIYRDNMVEYSLRCRGTANIS